MQYKIESIGAQFSKKTADQLGSHLTSQSESGWKLHSVFQAEESGCLGIGKPSVTYFAIYVRE